MPEVPVEIRVTGFTVDRPIVDNAEEVLAVAEEIMSDIGMHLADLGDSATSGEVFISIGQYSATTGDV